MSEEEKKAIEYIKNIKSWWWDNSPDRVYIINKDDIEQFDIIINLIENKQNEKEPKYIFKISYARIDNYGGYDINHKHDISLVAETLEEAFKKLDEIDKYEHKKILGWNAEELLEEN